MSSFRLPAWVTPPRLGVAGSAVLAALVIAMLVLQPFAGVRPVYAHDNFTLTPESSSRSGVVGDAFNLESKDTVRVADVKALLSVKGTTDQPKLEQVNDRKIRISFDNPLPEQSVVSFHLDAQVKNADGTTSPRPYGWAFQTAPHFRINSSVPGDQSTAIPTNSGIEFTFNEDVDLADVQKAFTITPNVDGRFELHQRTATFVPKALAPRTLYTVKIDGTVHAKGTDGTVPADTLAGGYQITFETGVDGKTNATFKVNRSNLFFRPDEAPFLPMALYFPDDQNWYSSPQTVAVNVDVHALPNLDAYKSAMDKDAALGWRSFAKAEDVAAVSTLPSVLKFTATTVAGDPYSGQYIPFPSALPLGYYLAVVHQKDGSLETWGFFQSTDVATYVVPAINKTIVWVNDTTTHKPIEGAKVDLVDSTDSFKTDAKGLATVIPNVPVVTDIGKGGEQWQIRVSAKGQTLLLPVYASSPSKPQDYRSYVYTDRPMYQPGDDMQFWGFATRLSDGTHPKTVRVAIEPYVSLDVKPDASGFFSGTLSGKDVPSGYHTIHFIDPDTSISFAFDYALVEAYTKPLYFLTLTTDKDAVFAGDTVAYTVHGEFFDGTPMKALQVAVSTVQGLDQKVTLDEAGNAHGSFAPTSGNMPENVQIFAKPVRPEEGLISATTQVYVFASRAYINVNDEVVGADSAHLVVRARNVNPAASWNADDFTTTPRADLSIKGTVTESTYTRTQVGQYYDFIEKVSHPMYIYDEHQRVLRTVTLKTDADGLASYDLPTPNKEANYSVSFEETDERGGSMSTTAYVWKRYDVQQMQMVGLQFKNPDDFVGGSGGMGNTAATIDVGATARLDVVHPDGSDLLMKPDARLLLLRAQEGIRSVDILSAPHYQFTFDAADVPNIAVRGVYFDGQAYVIIQQTNWWNAGSFVFSLRQETRQLTVKTELDKTAYGPGETATVHVSVTDPKGAPVASTVNVNVVDEAFYAVQDETVYPLAALYVPINDGVSSPFISHELFAYNPAAGGAEKGGGGGREDGAPRKHFKDTAAFVTIRTGSDGTAQAQIALPDNVTTWRVTSQAISNDGLQAGNSRAELISSLPFFVTPVIHDTYLPQDQPTVLLRAGGTDVGSGDAVEYHVTVPDVSIDKTITGTAGGTARIAIPSLPLGDHEITITGTVGSHHDAVTRTIHIVPSWVLRPTQARVDLSATPQSIVSSSKGQSEDVTFVDGGIAASIDALSLLVWQDSDRGDDAEAAWAAAQLLNTKFDQPITLVDHRNNFADPTTFGIRLFSYANVDPTLSARVALLGTEGSNTTVYFRQRLDSGKLTDRETAQALAALAVQGEPVLSDLQAFIARTNIKPSEQDDAMIWAALGLHALGDDENARAVYLAYEPKLKTEDGMTYLPSDDEQTKAERSADLAILAEGLRMPEADGLMNYLRNGMHVDTRLNIERFVAEKERLARLPAEAKDPAVIAFTIGDHETTMPLSAWMSSVHVGPNGLSNVHVVKGTAYAIVDSMRPVSDDEPTDSSVQVTRSYTVAGSDKPTTTFHEGDVVKVVLTYQVPRSSVQSWTSFRLVDALPSGLSALTPPNSYPGVAGYATDFCATYPSDVDGQRVTFSVYPGEWVGSLCPPKTITYYARVVTPGTYAAESPVLFSNDDPKKFTYLRSSGSVTIEP